MKKREVRQLAKAELRARAGNKAGRIEGYAAVFNELSEDLGGFRETLLPGAFTECLAAAPDVRCLFNHDSSAILGRTTAKTLTLEEDTKGLRFSCDLPETQAARDLLTSIERGDVTQCSFGFYVRKQRLAEEEDDEGKVTLIRELLAVELFDVSPVTFPAYPQTSVDTRALWPEGKPASLRAMLRAGKWLEAEERQEECECTCTACEGGDCAECSNQVCDDETCADDGCPNQAGRSLRGTVAFKSTPASSSDSWDGAAARGRLAKWASSDGSGDKDKVSWSQYAQGFAWFDTGDSENFGAYKLPHHDVSGGKLVSVWGGVRAAMSALLGGRGGTSISGGDRRGVYNHLAKEYRLHDKDVPDFHALLAGNEEERWTLEARLRLAGAA